MLRRYTQFDYATISEWGRKRQFPVLPPEFLPRTGLIHENYCVGFLYGTDSKICLMEWVISNPDSDKEERNIAMNELICALLEEAKRQGFKIVFSSVEAANEKLVKRYESNRFVVTDRGMSNMIKDLR
jgi:hypothetical protein